MVYGLGQGVEKKRIWPFILGALIVIAVILAVIFILPSFSIGSKKCADKACFVTAANNCENVAFEQLEEGSLFGYSARSCVLTKTLKKMNETEPAEMKDLLEGKSLSCKYSAESFNENWVNTLSLDLGDCTGDLKDAIDELAAAV